MKDLTIIIPTLNEGKNIKLLISKLLELYPGVSIIVSDDGSKDNTRKDTESFKGKKIIFFDHSKSKNKGLTGSVIDAIPKTRTEFVIVMDGDLQHPPEKIRNIYNNLKKGSSMVVGSRARRYIKWASTDRKFLSDFGTGLARLFLALKGIRVIDPLSGFFGFRKDLFSRMKPRRFVVGGYKVLFDMLKQMNRRDKVSEIFFNFGFRNGGKSKLSSRHFFYFLESFFK